MCFEPLAIYVMSFQPFPMFYNVFMEFLMFAHLYLTYCYINGLSMHSPYYSSMQDITAKKNTMHQMPLGNHPTNEEEQW